MTEQRLLITKSWESYTYKLITDGETQEIDPKRSVIQTRVS